MSNFESFVFYESFYNHMQRLKEVKGVDVAYRFAEALCEFGLYGVLPQDNDEVWIYGLEQAFTSISAAKERYNKAIEDGAKGGRKKIDVDLEELKKLKELGWSNGRIGKELGVSESTISRRCKEICWEDPFYVGEGSRYENPQKILDEINQNSQNQSVSENLNVNDNVNDNAN